MSDENTWTLEQLDEINLEAMARSGTFEVSYFTRPPGDPAPAPSPHLELVYLAAQLVCRARPGLGRDQLDAHGTREVAERIVALIDTA